MIWTDILLASVCAVGLVALLGVILNDLTKDILDSGWRDVVWQEYAGALILIPALIYCAVRLLALALGAL